MGVVSKTPRPQILIKENLTALIRRRPRKTGQRLERRFVT
jgi:hypothetical protein